MVNRCHRFLTDRLFRNPVFLVCVAVYLALRLALWWQPAQVPPILVHHLADFLCLPIVLTLATGIQRHFILSQAGYGLNKWQVLFAVVYFSVLFELVFPHFYSRYTTDIADVLAYALGGAAYWFFINPGSGAKEKI